MGQEVCQEGHSTNSSQFAGSFALSPGTADLARACREARSTPSAGSLEEADAVAVLDAARDDELAALYAPSTTQQLLRRRERAWHARTRHLKGY
jgi:hypothetical protein